MASTHNPLLLEIRKAAHAGRPTADGFIVAEGPHLLEEVGRAQWTVERVFCTAEARERFPDLLHETEAPVTMVSMRAFSTLATTETTQGLLALVRPQRWTWDEVIGGTKLAVILDSIQDPGNVGTIARSAEAFGAGGILLTDGCARVSNGKVLRASAGSLFRIPYLERVTRAETLNRLSSAGLKMYALTAAGGTPHFSADLRNPCALAVGNEGSGVADEFSDVAEALSISTVRVESLNAAVACSIVLCEAMRQRNSP